MNHPFQPISATAAERIREKSVAFRQDEFAAAEAEADAALHELADYACAAKFSRQEAIEKMADLTMRSHAAERRRAAARHHYRLELESYARSTMPSEGAE